MTLEITSPTGVTKIVKANSDNERAFYAKWEKKGYVIKELKVSSAPPESSCQSCEG